MILKFALRQLIVIWLISGLLIFSVTRVSGSSNVSISISPSRLDIENGDTFTLDLIINTDTPIRGWQMGLEFDDDKLSCTDIAEGDFLQDYADSSDSAMAIECSTPDINNSKGTIHDISYAIVGGDAGGATGTGTLCIIEFTAKDDAQGSCTIKPVNVILINAESNPTAIPDVTVNKGSVRVENTNKEDSTPTPSSTSTPEDNIDQEPTPSYTPDLTETPGPTPTETTEPTPDSSPTGTTTPEPDKQPAPPLTPGPTGASPTAEPGAVATPDSPIKSVPAQPTLIFDLTGLTDPQGAIIINYLAEKSAEGNTDLKATVEMKKGTLALTGEGQPVSSIKITKTGLPRYLIKGLEIIAGFECTPDKSTFSPPLRLTIQYDPSILPAGIAENSLVLAYYDVPKGKWVELDSQTDPARHTITAQVGHFTWFAIATLPKSAAPASPGNWGILIGIIAAAIVIAAIILYCLVRRRRGRATAGGPKSTLESYLSSSLPNLYEKKDASRNKREQPPK